MSGPTRGRKAQRRSDVCARIAGARKLAQETVSDFRHRIAQIMREREQGKRFSLVGAAPANPCVVRVRRRKRRNADAPKAGNGEFGRRARDRFCD
jgi:hypothetical protein